MSINSTVRLTCVSKSTILKLVPDLGFACEASRGLSRRGRDADFPAEWSGGSSIPSRPAPRAASTSSRWAWDGVAGFLENLSEGSGQGGSNLKDQHEHPDAKDGQKWRGDAAYDPYGHRVYVW